MASGRFQKGDPRVNRNGAPKKGARAKDYLEQHITESDVALAIAIGVKSGDINMIKLAAEYMWGKPVQQVDQNITSIDKGATFRFEIIECPLQLAESKPTSSDQPQGQ